MSKNLINNTSNSKLPNHVAIIMDGNGRWAKQRNKVRTFGHSQAVSSVKNAIEACDDLGIKYLTLFAFSSENWNRPKLEVDTLMRLLVTNIRKEINTLNEKNIKINIIGNVEKIPKKVLKEVQEAQNITQNNNKGILTIALSYGSKEEIVEATKNIVKDVIDQKLKIEEISETVFSQHLYTHDLPDVDLLIRTSGEQRISNFLLWQIAYAELYFTETLWPDFNKEDFFKAIEFYQQKERRFGKTSEQIIQ